MSNPAPFAPIAELLERSLSIRHVYGEPVQRGDTTVIPVAKVAYGFGAGGGRGPGRGRPHAIAEGVADEPGRTDAQGAGGGGGVLHGASADSSAAHRGSTRRQSQRAHTTR